MNKSSNKHELKPCLKKAWIETLRLWEICFLDRAELTREMGKVSHWNFFSFVIDGSKKALEFVSSTTDGSRDREAEGGKIYIRWKEVCVYISNLIQFCYFLSPLSIAWSVCGGWVSKSESCPSLCVVYCLSESEFESGVWGWVMWVYVIEERQVWSQLDLDHPME